jgi:hypothetical protein
MSSTLPPPAATLLDADDLQWDLPADGPWPTTDHIVSTAIRALPTIDDPLAAALIGELLHAIVNLRERGRSFQALVTKGLDEWHDRHRADLRRQRLREHRREQGKGRAC